MKLTVGTRGSKLALAQTNRTLTKSKQKTPTWTSNLKLSIPSATKNTANHSSALTAKGFLRRKSTKKSSAAKSILRFTA